MNVKSFYIILIKLFFIVLNFILMYEKVDITKKKLFKFFLKK